MARSKVEVTRLQGRLGRVAPNTDGVAGFVTNGVAVTDKLVLGTVYILKSLADLEALGVTAAYDDTNNTLIHHHVSRWYARNPQAEIHIMVLAKTVTLTQMLDVENAYAAKISKDSKGRVKLIAAARNPADDYTATLDDGLDADVLTAIPKAQALKAFEDGKGREVSFVIEGREYNGTVGSAADLRTLNAPGVSVVIAADNDISKLKAIYDHYAAVGDFMGMLTKASVSQNAGELVAEFNLQDTARGFFLNPGLSSGTKLSTYSDADLDTLDEKGFIFAETPDSFDGVYFNDMHTCVALTSDYAFVENNRTIDKMKRLARVAVLPRVKSKFDVDADTGFIDPNVKANLEDTVIDALDVMRTDGDLSGGIDAYIPDINLLGGDPIEIEITAVPVAIGREIKVSVGFTNPFNN
jgi:hypothetical protein